MPVAPPEDFNFSRHLQQINAERSEHLAFIDDYGAIRYGDLAARIKRFASALLARGLIAGDRILLVMPDRIEWPIAFLGAMYAGLIPVPVNTLLTVADYAYLLEHSAAAAAVVTMDLQVKLAQAKALLGGVEPLFFIAVGTAPADEAATLSFECLMAGGDDRYQGANTRQSEVAFWLYSSGSTGRPKGVPHTHSSLYWTAELYAKPVLGIAATDRVFSAAKLFFAYGLGNALTFPMSVGGVAILMAERPTPAAVLRRLLRDEATIFCGAPTLYASLVATEPHLVPTKLRLCTSAGEALPAEVGIRFAQRYGVDVLDGLGSTEMLHIFLSNRISDIAYGTSGVPVPGYQVQLRDEQGHTVDGCQQTGDLWVKGPSAASCYLNDAEKTRSTFCDGWVRTGDKYHRREDGRFVYAGRNDDMLKISGQYISPFEVESMLMQHPAVLESAVIAVADALGISKCKAYVVLKHGHQASPEFAEELKGFVKSRLAPFKRPHRIEFASELPKTATGKIQRYRLRELSG